MRKRYRMFLSDPASRLWTWLLAAVMFAAFLLSCTTTAHAYGLTECPASRYGDDLGCTAGDVSITGIRVIGDTSSCTGGIPVTLDLELTVNFANPDRWDVGIFISNDGKSPQLRPASGGAASCSVSILPTTSPFQNLDSNGGTDTCGDGGGNLVGLLYMPGVTVACQSVAGGGGNLFIPFVVSWDNQASPSGATCTSIANPVPNTKSKCNAPTILQGSVSVVVLPTITNTDGVTFVSSGETVTYTVVITNTTGVTLSGAVFTDPAVTNINVSSVTCSASGGATCPATSVAAMQGAGITIPNMPANGSVTFTITATLAGTPPDTLTNTASVTVNGQFKSVSDTDTIVGTIAIIPSNLSKYGTAGTLITYNYTLYNFGTSTDTISLSALSNHNWTVTSPAPITLASGTSSPFTVSVQIPPGESIGMVDVTTITATSGIDPTKKATATATATVGAPLTLTPDNTGAGGKGAPVFYSHRVQNNTAVTRTANFSVVYSGPSCGSWSTVLPAPAVLAPFGGYADVVVRVNVPAGAATSSICAVTITADTGFNAASAVDTTTVKDLVLYSDPGYTDESYIFPTGNAAYARAFGTLATGYRFYWYGSDGALKRTSPILTGPGTLSDTLDPIPVGGPLGTWRVVVRTTGGAFFAEVFFYVGPDHIQASYTGTNPVPANTNATIELALHGRNHAVPMDPVTGNVVQGSPPTTKDPLKITVTVSGAATIVGTTGLTGAVIAGQTVTGLLSGVTGTASITITDTVHETVTVTPTSFNAALYGSALVPTRDESAAVNFVIRRMRILYWREMAQ